MNYIGDIGNRMDGRIDADRLRELACTLAERDKATGAVQPYSDLLLRLSVFYGRMPSHIANTTVASHELLQRYKISSTLLELLEDMACVQARLSVRQEQVYSQVLCMYVFMRNEGKSREGACNALVVQLTRSGAPRN